jgi:hypothetical protein
VWRPNLRSDAESMPVHGRPLHRMRETRRHTAVSHVGPVDEFDN